VKHLRVNDIRLWLAVGFVAVGGMGGCRCGRDVGVNDEESLARDTIVDKNPQADRPNVNFPSSLMTEDVSVNKFIQQALDVCYRGDYDGFRQLFATSYKPTGQDDFERVWHGVRSIEVVRVEKHPRKEPPIYFVHAEVQLRQPDRQGRKRRDVVVMVVDESGEWRLGIAPAEIAKAMIAVDNQPELLSTQPGGQAD
jgi:hypothetical protein